MKDPLYGKDNSLITGASSGAPRIRSLQIKNHDIYIDDGSPVSVRLDAALKLTVSAGLAPQIAHLEDVIRSKEAANRPKDVAVLPTTACSEL